MREIRDRIFTYPEDPEGDDAITCKGKDNENIIDHCIIDFRNLPLAEQDEMMSGVAGAIVTLTNSILIGGKKALLCGNGDHAELDKQQARWTIKNCVIMGCGRRTPEAQDGTQIYMENCWVHNWGAMRDDRTFGAWAHTGGRIVAKNCIFSQSGGIFSLGLMETIKDIGYHIGQVWNDTKLLGVLTNPKMFLPGVCRGLTADDGGQVQGIDIYKNKWWILTQNSTYMSRTKAVVIAEQLEQSCPSTLPILGYELLEYFYAVVMS